MTGQPELWTPEIHRRIACKRRKRARRQKLSLGVACFALFCGTAALLHQVQSFGVVNVEGVYGSVLLREGAGAYVLVGVAAFAAGTVMTLLSLRWKGKHRS